MLFLLLMTAGRRTTTFNRMVPLVSFLAALRILTEAQSCNNGAGRLMFERVADYKLSGGGGGAYSNTRRAEVITRRDLPIRVLSECIRRCAEDRTTSPHVSHCRSFDFVPGRRLRKSDDEDVSSSSELYEESTCYLYSDQASPDGTETLVRQPGVWHYNEVCITATSKSTSGCGNRLYAVERWPGFRLRGGQGSSDREVFASNRSDCEGRCLSETSFRCRSCSFDRAASVCRMSGETRSSHPAGYEPDANSDYAENLCLAGPELCTASALILEAGKELSGPYDRDLFTVRDFKECSDRCLHSLEERGFPCRAFLYADARHRCTLYADDPLADTEGDEMGKKPLVDSRGDLYRLFCGSSDRVRGVGGNSGGPAPPRGGGAGWPSGTAAASSSSGGAAMWPGGGMPQGAWSPVGGGGGSSGGMPVSWPSSGMSDGAWPQGGGAWGASGPPGGWTSSGLWPSVGAPALPPWASPHLGWPPVPPPIGPHSAHGPLFPPPPYPPPELCGKNGGGGALFKKIGHGMRLRSHFVVRVLRADTQPDCERACAESRDFACLSFNFRPFFPDNCELSDQDSHVVALGSPYYFELNTQFDFYEREPDSAGLLQPGCLDVSQSCTLDGMEFSLKTPDGFYGRIYTYGFYDTCFYDGNGGNVNVLRISRANGFPRCGTQQYGDVMTNIVVVQFNDFVQTSRDKKYNLTCYFAGPGEAVVTSNYLDTRTDGRYPTQIEHLPAQNVLTSSVGLKILYRGAPTTTIAVGDLLTFRLEARGNFHWEYFADIFATNVIAKDPYSGRQVHLIDARGCPVDLYVFPELHRTPDGALEAEFYAFKIPDSNLLVFQATVQTCRGPCEPVICSDKSRPGTFPSWGRRRKRRRRRRRSVATPSNDTSPNEMEEEEEHEEVHELLKVYLSRSEIPPEEMPNGGDRSGGSTVCVAQSGYYGIISTVVILMCLVVGVVGMAYFFIRRTRRMVKKMATSSSGLSVEACPSSQFRVRPFADPSEPIYTDPALFERPRNTLRNITLGKFAHEHQ